MNSDTAIKDQQTLYIVRARYIFHKMVGSDEEFKRKCEKSLEKEKNFFSLPRPEDPTIFMNKCLQDLKNMFNGLF